MKLKKMPVPRRAGKRDVEAELRVAMRRLADDPEALELVTRFVELLEKRSPVRRR